MADRLPSHHTIRTDEVLGRPRDGYLLTRLAGIADLGLFGADIGARTVTLFSNDTRVHTVAGCGTGLGEAAVRLDELGGHKLCRSCGDQLLVVFDDAAAASVRASSTLSRVAKGLGRHTARVDTMREAGRGPLSDLMFLVCDLVSVAETLRGADTPEPEHRRAVAGLAARASQAISDVAVVGLRALVTEALIARAPGAGDGARTIVVTRTEDLPEAPDTATYLNTVLGSLAVEAVRGETTSVYALDASVLACSDLREAAVPCRAVGVGADASDRGPLEVLGALVEWSRDRLDPVVVACSVEAARRITAAAV